MEGEPCINYTSPNLFPEHQQSDLGSHADYSRVKQSNPNLELSRTKSPRNSIAEQLQAANAARSASPSSAIPREPLPFREMLPHTTDGTAARSRQKQKDEAIQAESPQRRPPLRREPIRTTDPQDALLGDGQTQWQDRKSQLDHSRS